MSQTTPAGARTEMLPEARRAIEIADKHLSRAPMAARVALANDILAMFNDLISVTVKEVLDDGIRRAALAKTGAA